MWKIKIVTGVVIVLGFLLLMVTAYKQSLLIENLHAHIMGLDIQSFTQRLAQTGMTPDHIRIFRSILFELNRTTSLFVYSEVLNLIGIFSMMGILIMVYALILVGRTPDPKKEEGSSSKKV
jgi:asparagine N-glycosylation enzyme membrane subunit Stt3